jgi:hypothetical protein
MRSLKTPKWPGLALAVATLVTSGCSSMSKDECLAVDWRTIGYEDGVEGYPGDHIAQHRKACAKYGVRADLELYQDGRRQGLREFCQPINGYHLGARGGSYGGVCPAELGQPFLAAFDSGHELYELTARVFAAEAELESKRRELARVEHGIIQNSAEAISADAAADQRAHAVLDAAQLAGKAGRLKVEIQELAEDSVRYHGDLDAYRANHPPMG